MENAAMKSFTVYVLLRFSKKTGKIDTTMVGMGTALMRMWALNNTTKTKACFIVERDSGEIEFATYGTEDFPKVKDSNEKRIGNIEDFGIPLDEIRSIEDDRFDD